jgi:hypothetical protein
MLHIKYAMREKIKEAKKWLRIEFEIFRNPLILHFKMEG